MVTAKVLGFVKVILGDVPFWQTVVVPLTVAVGVAKTVTVAVPEIVVEQATPDW